MLTLLFRKSQPVRFVSSFATKLKTMKLESSKFQEVLTPELGTLSSMFTKHGYELRIAGGAVRDLLMDKAPADVDFATTATPDQMKDMFEKEEIRMINNQGEKHGTITARINDKENYEVTTLRIDKVTDGRHAEVEFTTDWQLDANRRDLTINSMFLGLDGMVYDYFNGTKDLEARKVKFVGDPVQRIQEDYLRILRYFRFYGRIAVSADDHDSETLEAIKENVSGMERISGERIWMEWKKILTGNYAKELTVKMLEVGLGPYIGLPAEPDIKEFLKVCSLSESLMPTAMVAALLKDQAQVMTLHDRLKLSGQERDLCLFVVANRGDIPHPIPIRPYQFLAVDSKAKVLDTRLFIDQVLKYRGDTVLAKEFAVWEMPRFGVTGNHLKEAGCPPGKIMSVILGKLKETWKEQNFEISLEELLSQIPQVLDSIDPVQLAEMSSTRKKKTKTKF